MHSKNNYYKLRDSKFHRRKNLHRYRETKHLNPQFVKIEKGIYPIYDVFIYDCNSELSLYDCETTLAYNFKGIIQNEFIHNGEPYGYNTALDIHDNLNRKKLKNDHRCYKYIYKKTKEVYFIDNDVLEPVEDVTKYFPINDTDVYFHIKERLNKKLSNYLLDLAVWNLNKELNKKQKYKRKIKHKKVLLKDEI